MQVDFKSQVFNFLRSLELQELFGGTPNRRTIHKMRKNKRKIKL